MATPKAAAEKRGFIRGADIREIASGRVARVVGHNGGKCASPQIRVEFLDEPNKKYIKSANKYEVIKVSPSLTQASMELSALNKKSANKSKPEKIAKKPVPVSKEEIDALDDFEERFQEEKEGPQTPLTQANASDIINNEDDEGSEISCSSSSADGDDSNPGTESEIFQVSTETVDHIVNLIRSLCLSPEQLEHVINSLNEG